MDRKEREKIEIKGVPVVMAILLYLWEVGIADIEMVTDRKRQYKGIDYILWSEDKKENVKIDSKFHLKKARKQNYTDYGVDIISIEITKANGLKGWGINNKLETDYIIDIINGYGFYIIDSSKLHGFMIDNYSKYPIMYKATGREDYRAVSIKELMAEGIILYWVPWKEIEKEIEKINEDKHYKDTIEPLLNALITV